MPGMNSQFMLTKLKSRFENYVSRFSSDDPAVKENFDLKAEHTRRVCEATVDIGGSVGLSTEALCIAEACGLLHDIGRFEQYSRYRTFSDNRSEDHAALGVEIIQSSRIMDGIDPAVADLVVWVVKYHNAAGLPVEAEESRLFFLKLLRDADKLDIWRVVTGYYQHAGNNRNRAIELDLPDTELISSSVYDSLMEGKVVQMIDLKTLTDFKLLQIGWIYDINFRRTFQIVRETGYLEIIRDALPGKSPCGEEIYERARAYLEMKASTCRASVPKPLTSAEKAATGDGG